MPGEWFLVQIQRRANISVKPIVTLLVKSCIEIECCFADFDYDSQVIVVMYTRVSIVN